MRKTKTKTKSEMHPVPGCRFCKYLPKTKFYRHCIVSGILICKDDETHDGLRLLITIARPSGHKPFTAMDLRDINKYLSTVMLDHLSDYKIVSTDKYEESDHPYWKVNLVAIDH